MHLTGDQTLLSGHARPSLRNHGVHTWYAFESDPDDDPLLCTAQILLL